MAVGITFKSYAATVRISMGANRQDAIKRRIVKYRELTSRSGLYVYEEFLWSYYSCEYVAKSLQAGRKGKRTESESHVNVASLEAALKYYGVKYHKNDIQPIFEGSQRKVATKKKSARGLRDAIVHGMHTSTFDEIKLRGLDLNQKMNRFLSAVETVIS